MSVGNDVKMSTGIPKDEVFSMTVDPRSEENAQNDHSQIFPLLDGRLMLVWCEYYVNRPSGLGAMLMRARAVKMMLRAGYQRRSQPMVAGLGRED